MISRIWKGLLQLLRKKKKKARFMTKKFAEENVQMPNKLINGS